jgi:hypothetical protein
VIRLLVAGLVAASLWGEGAAGQVEVRATLSQDTIGLDQSLEYRVMVGGSGLQDVEEPEFDLPVGLTLFGRSKSSEVSVVGGGVERRTTFTFVYRPFRLGVIPIGPGRVSVGGATYVVPPVQVTVVPERAVAGLPPLPRLPPLTGPDSLLVGAEGDEALTVPLGEAVFVTNRLDKDEVYVGEQLLLTFAFYQSPRAVVLDQPNYSSAKTPGFWTQDLNREPQISRELIGGEPYTIQRFHYGLFPLTSGEKAIAPATLTLTLRAPASFLDRGRTRTLSADTLRLTVKPLPEDGRPTDFEGAVGRYRVAARVEPRDVERDAPATLTLTVSGEGNVATIPAPRLSAPSGLKVFDPEVKTRVAPRNLTVGGEKEFRYLLVPKRPGALDLGTASLAYFDPWDGVYRRASADLGTLAVRPASGSGARAEEEQPLVLAGIRRGGVGGAPAPAWRAPLFWVLAAFPFLAAALVLASRRKVVRRAPPAHARLAAAAVLRRDPGPGGVGEAEREVAAYLESRYGAALSGRSVAAREQALWAAGVPAETVARAGGALRALEAVAFAPPPARAAALEEAHVALRALEEVERGAAPRRARWR